MTEPYFIVNSKNGKAVMTESYLIVNSKIENVCYDWAIPYY